MKKLILGFFVGWALLMTAGCDEDKQGVIPVGEGDMFVSHTDNVLTIDEKVTITTKIVGTGTAKVSLIKNRTDTVLVAAAPVTNNLCTVTLDRAQLGLEAKGDVATVWIQADGFHDTRTITVVEPEWKWTAVKGNPYSTMEKSTVANKVTFELEAPWLVKLDSLKLNVSGKAALAGKPTLVGGKIVVGVASFDMATDAFVGGDGDKRNITIEATYTVDSTKKATHKFVFDCNITQDTYTKSAAYTFTDANEVSDADPLQWDATDKAKTFFGLYDGKEYKGVPAPASEDAKQPVLFLYNGGIYNVNNGTAAYTMEFFPFGVGKPDSPAKPGAKDLTDRSRATNLIGVTGLSDSYAGSAGELENYYYVKIGSPTEPTYVGTLRLTKTLAGTVELSFNYDVRRNTAVE